MKTTGRIELTQADPEFYFIDDIVHYNNIPALHVNNITDIREEVDWSKVKKGTPVVEYRKDDAYQWFFAGYNLHEERKSWPIDLCGSFKGAKLGQGSYHCGIENLMLLTDWLEKHGNKEAIA